MSARSVQSSIIFSGVLLFAILQTACRGHGATETGIPITPTRTPNQALTATLTLESTQTLPPTNTLIPTVVQTITPKPSNIILPTKTPVPISTRTPRASSTPLPADSTRWAWQATALVVATAERALAVQTGLAKATQIAQFPVPCDNLIYNNISPDGQWYAASCGYDSNQTLSVQDRSGTKWVLEFNDFLPPDIHGGGMMGMLIPEFWSPEGDYLYFTLGLGHDGGGNECFPASRGAYGLFRLSLKTGVWVTLVPPTDWFPGYEIDFSPTGRRYAVSINGVMIMDLQTGEVTEIGVSGELEGMLWSPDGKHLAYTVSVCGEAFLHSSSVYVWDVATQHTQFLATIEGKLLTLEAWIDNSTLRIIGYKPWDQKPINTIYEFDIAQNRLISTATATPSP